MGTRLAALAAGLVLAAALPVRSQSQEPASATRTISGSVIDSVTGLPVREAQVTLRPGKRKLVTGSDGRFAFKDVPAGKVTLKVEHFASRSRTVALAPDASTATVFLLPDAHTIEGLMLINKDLDHRTRVGARLYWTRDLLASGTASLTEFLVKMKELANDRVYPGNPYVYLDDWYQRAGLHGMSYLPLEDIYAVEVIPTRRVVFVYSNDYIENLARYHSRM